MRLSLPLALGLFLFGLPARAADRIELPEETYTLDTSIRRALQNNPSVLTAEGDIKLAEGKIQEAASLLYPKVDFNFNFSKHRTESTFVLPPDLGLAALGPPAGTGTTGTAVEDLYTTRLGMRQYLFTGGRISSTRKLARANLKAAEIRLEAARKEVICSVTAHFYDVLLKRLVLAAYRRHQKDLSDLPRDGQAGSRLALEQELSRLRLAISDQEQALEAARLAYLNAAGLELFKRVELEGELVTQPVEIELDKLIAWSVEGRPELRETRTEEEVNQLSVDLSLAQRNPTVAFGAGYELRDSNLALGTNNWNATINLNLPLFDGFSTLSRVRQSRSQAELGRAKKARLYDQVQMEVRRAFQECHHWQAELSAREGEIRRAEGMAADYASGRVSFPEWLRFRAWRLELNVRRDQAVFEHIAARARLERAVGRAVQ